MAFEIKYRCEWYDRLKLKWRYDILEDGFSGSSITDLVASADPLTIDFLSGSDDIFESNIRGSKCDLRVKVSTSFVLADLYTVQDRKFKVNIYYNTTSLFWTGYIVSNNYQEAYNDTPYDVVISANDGLGYLKQILYDDAGTAYDGRILESQIIIDILAKIGVVEFKEYINVYETGMANGTGDSPMDQNKIDVDIFKDYYCYGVLEELLKKYCAIIRQVNGEYVIYRPKELAGATVYGRKFTAATTKSSVSITPAQNINRSGAASDIRDVNGGTMMIQPPMKKIILNQNYGWKQSWLESWEFRADDYSTSWPGWDKVGTGIAYLPVGMSLPVEKSGVIMGVDGATAPDTLHYLFQDFGYYAKSTTDIFIIDFSYLLYNTSGSTVNDVDVYVEVKNAAGDQFLRILSADTCEWVGTQAYITIRLNSTPGSTGWLNFIRRIVGIPSSGNYKISLFSVDESADVRVAFKDIKFYSTSDQIAVMDVVYENPQPFEQNGSTYIPKDYAYEYYKSIQTVILKRYEVENAINGFIKEYNFLLGDVTDSNIDNVVEQFAGSLASSLPGLTGVASAFVTDFAADYLSGGVVVTSSGAALIFEAQVAGVNFTGSTTIINLTGDLNGSVAATTANQAAIWTIELGGASGEINIIVNSISRAATIVTTLDAAAATFLSNYGTAFPGVVVSNPSGAILTFTGGVTSFTIQEVSGDMNATGGKIQDGIKRKDTLTLSGTYGTANVLCDGVTKEASFKLAAAAAWSTRGGSEADPILELIAAEIAYQYSRPKQFLQLPIMESGVSAITPNVNILGNFQDALNQVSAANRIFIFSQGSFRVKDRSWNIDLIELIQ